MRRTYTGPSSSASPCPRQCYRSRRWRQVPCARRAIRCRSGAHRTSPRESLAASCQPLRPPASPFRRPPCTKLNDGGLHMHADEFIVRGVTMAHSLGLVVSVWTQVDTKMVRRKRTRIQCTNLCTAHEGVEPKYQEATTSK